jgi:hypothetical protein
MRRSDKAAGRFGLVLLVVALVVAALYFTGWGAVIKNVAVVAWRGNAMVNLAKRTPFTPPSAGIVPEERLQAYLDVCDRIKPAGDKIDEWEAAHARAGSKLVFKGGAAGLVENFIDQFNLALQQQRMGPEEFAWIVRQWHRVGNSPRGDTRRPAVGSGGAAGSYPDRIAAAIACTTRCHSCCSTPSCRSPAGVNR